MAIKYVKSIDWNVNVDWDFPAEKLVKAMLAQGLSHAQIRQVFSKYSKMR